MKNGLLRSMFLIGLFGVSVAFLHGLIQNKKQKKEVVQISDGNIEQILSYLQPLLYTRSPEILSRALLQFKPKTVVQLIQQMIKDPESPLQDEEKVQLMFSLAHHFLNDPLVKPAVYRLLSEHEFQVPPFYAAAKSTHPNILADVQRVLKEENKLNVLEHLRQKAFDYLVSQNDLDALEVLYTHGVRPTADQASRMLWNIVKNNLNIEFVPFLVKYGNADINFSGDAKHSLLMQAVLNQNIQMVQALLEQQPDVNKIVDPAVGTALQLAFEQGLADIEILLRDHGAK